MYIPHFAYSFIHWWTHGCFDILAVVKNAAMNICKQIFFKTLEWNCHIIIPSLIFFYTAAISPYISTNRVQQFQFLHILISIYYFTLKKNSIHPNRCEVVSHCNFDLHFLNNQKCWGFLPVLIGHLHISFGQMSIQVLCSFKLGFVVVEI